MNYKQLRRTCSGILLLGIFTLLLGAWNTHERPTPPSAAPSWGAAIAALPDQFTIDIADVSQHLRDKPQKEVDDQLRDWAVYGTLVQLGLDKDTLGKATFKMAPVRLPYLEEAFVFDYGRGRRAIVGEKDVLLFYEESDPDPVATLGRTADKVRMEIGEIPEVFQVFATSPDLAAGTIHIARKPSVSGTTMFGPDYGYLEQTIIGLDDFKAWLESIDDVTFTGVSGQMLRVGGRRFPKSRTKGVTVDDVAALLQAQQELADKRGENQRTVERVPDAPGFSLDPAWNPAGLADALDQLAKNPCIAIKDAYKILNDAKRVAFDDDAMPLLLSAAWGLLDATLDKPSSATPCADLAKQYGDTLRRMAQDVRAAGAAQDTLASAMLPIWRMRDQRGTPEAEIASRMAGFVQARHQLQCARYDGALQGTRVGMNLFYTDLLAKLWQSVDYHHSAPAAFVPGFIAKPRMKMEPAWEEEARRLPSTRVWFGPRPEGYTRNSAGNTMWLDHIATRVFAAGSDPANPGKENQPSESSRRSLGWWDRHYADVADYEQQYHVQNQIIKWSLITGFQREKLLFLRAVPVDHEQRFDRWYEHEKAGLRYQHPIPLRPASDWVTHTECIDLLGSYLFRQFGSSIHQISGGVSLGGRSALKAMPEIGMTAPRSLRLNVAAAAEEGVGTAVRVRPSYKGAGEAIVKLDPVTRTRFAAGELKLGGLKTTYAEEAGGAMKVALRGEHGEVGALVGGRVAPGRVKLSWNAEMQETARTLAGERAQLAVKEAGNPGSEVGASALRGPKLRATIALEGNSAELVLDAESGRALRLKVGNVGGGNGTEVTATAEGPVRFVSKPAKKGVEIKAQAGKTAEAGVDFLSKGATAKELDGYEWQRITSDEATAVRQSVRRTFTNKGPTGEARKVVVRGIDGFSEGVEFHVEQDGSFLVRRPAAEGQRASWRDLDLKAELTGADIQRISTMARAEGATVIDRASLSDPAVGRTFDALQRNNAKGALDALESGTGFDRARVKEMVGQVQKRTVDNAEYQLAQGNHAEAGSLFKLSKDLGAKSPAMELRAALADLEGGRPGPALARLGEITGKPVPFVGDVRRAANGAELKFLADAKGLTLFGTPAEELRVVVDGPEPTTALRLERPLEGKIISMPDRKGLVEGIQRELRVYLDDRISLNRHDFEASSHGTLGELAVSPTTRWKTVEAEGSRYAPGILVEPNKEASAGNTQYRLASSRSGAPNVKTTVIFIRDCDRDRDGRLSEEERVACN